MGSELYLAVNAAAKESMRPLITRIAQPRNVTFNWADVSGREMRGRALLMNTPEASEYVVSGQYFYHIFDYFL
jgi:hypothetical protein